MFLFDLGWLIRTKPKKKKSSCFFNLSQICYSLSLFFSVSFDMKAWKHRPPAAGGRATVIFQLRSKAVVFIAGYDL